MSKFEVGSKLYHAYYRPLTVTSCDDKYVTVYFDEPRKSWPIPGTPAHPRHAVFLVEAFGHWYFDDAKKVGSETNDAPLAQQQTPKALIPMNRDYLHPYFTSKVKLGATQDGISGIDLDEGTPKKKGKVSGIKLDDSINAATGEVSGIRLDE